MSGLVRLVRAIPTLWRVAVASIVAYRAEMVIWILSATLPLVMMAIWSAATAEAPVGLFGQREVSRYFAVTMVVRQLTGAWIVWELNYMIRTGALSPQLLRPTNPLVFNLLETVAAIPWRLVVLAPLVAGVIAWRPEVVFWPGWGRLGAFLCSVGLAFLVAWLVQVLFGLAAFWLEQSQGLFSVYFAVWAYLSGYLVPAELLPEAVRASTHLLPFYASLGAPVDVLVGEGPVGPALAAQVGWVLGLGALASVLWSRGIRRYGAVGA